MKNYDFKFTTGSLFICSKCGKKFDEPERAEVLKTDLRAELAKDGSHKKVRVMVGSCLGVCEDGLQTFAYYPHEGKAEVYTTENNFDTSKSEILNFVKTKTTKA